MASIQVFKVGMPMFQCWRRQKLEGILDRPMARPSIASLIALIPEDAPLEVPIPMDLEGGMSHSKRCASTISGNQETVYRVTGQGRYLPPQIYHHFFALLLIDAHYSGLFMDVTMRHFQGTLNNSYKY